MKHLRILHGWLGRVGLDDAILLAVASRSWQSMAGVASLFFIVRFFSPTIQGYHYAFLSLISAQGLFELGIGIAILSFASHEWSELKFGLSGQVEGDGASLGRLSSLTRFAMRWYGYTACCFLIGGGSIGWVLLRSRVGMLEGWMGPWMLAVVAASLNLFLAGVVSVIEGCNQIGQVASMRLLQSVAGNVVFWAGAIAGLGLWSTGLLLAAMLVTGCLFVYLRYGTFVRQMLSLDKSGDLTWRAGLFAMQWPLAIQSIVGFFIFSFFVPAVFHAKGALEAGRLGLSLQIISALLGVTAAIITVRQPRLGVKVARGEMSAMTLDWQRGSVSALAIYAAGCIVAELVIVELSKLYPHIDGRLLPTAGFAVLAVWGFVTLSVQCLATYWRAFRIEPLGALSLFPGVFSGGFVWVGAQWAGAIGAVFGALLSALLVTLPLGLFGWRRARCLASRRDPRFNASWT